MTRGTATSQLWQEIDRYGRGHMPKTNISAKGTTENGEQCSLISPGERNSTSLSGQAYRIFIQSLFLV